MSNALLIFTGTLALIIGVMGILVPILPATPFLLLSAGLYVRSSPVLYNKIINNRITGRYLTGLNEGINIKTRIVAIAIMWTMILLTILAAQPELKITTALICLGIIGTIFKLLFLATTGKDKRQKTEDKRKK